MFKMKQKLTALLYRLGRQLGFIKVITPADLTEYFKESDSFVWLKLTQTAGIAMRGAIHRWLPEVQVHGRNMIEELLKYDIVETPHDARSRMLEVLVATQGVYVALFEAVLDGNAKPSYRKRVYQYHLERRYKFRYLETLHHDAFTAFKFMPATRHDSEWSFDFDNPSIVVFIPKDELPVVLRNLLPETKNLPKT